MMQNSRPPVWQMVREAVEALGRKTTNVAVRDWILKHYPGTKTNTIQCHIITCTVNHRSRIHYAYNKKLRLANGKYDFLFSPARGQIEWYVPQRHGVWEIFKDEDGKLGIRQRYGGELDQEPKDRQIGASRLETEPGGEELEETEGGTAFAAEAHLRQYLAQHLELVEPGLELFVDDDGKDGVEYRTDIGNIDLLAVDAEGGFVVIELKVSRGPDSVAGQVLRYKNWVRAHLAKDKRTRGIIIAQHITDRIRYAIASDPDVTAKEYEISLTLRDVDNVQLAGNDCILTSNQRT